LQDLLKLFNNYKPGWFDRINQQKMSNKIENTTTWLRTKKLPNGLPFTVKKKIDKDKWPLRLQHFMSYTTNLSKVTEEELNGGAGSFGMT